MIVPFDMKVKRYSLFIYCYFSTDVFLRNNIFESDIFWDKITIIFKLFLCYNFFFDNLLQQLCVLRKYRLLQSRLKINL